MAVYVWRDHAFNEHNDLPTAHRTLMEFSRDRHMELLALDCPLSLREVCLAMQHRFALSEFEFDRENETEWGLVEQHGIEYNVSNPYEAGTLQKWDSTVPVGCTIGIALVVSRDCPSDWDTTWSSSVLVPQIGQALADLLRCRIYHHRTWVGPGVNVARRCVFNPRLGTG